MTLAEAVEKFRPLILSDQMPNEAGLMLLVEVVKLNDAEYANCPNNDVNSQKWADFLLTIAKQRGIFGLCVKQRLLAKKYLQWPDENFLMWKKSKESKSSSQSVRTISAGAFEQNRRKH